MQKEELTFGGLQVVEFADHDLDLVEVDLELLEQTVDGHELGVLLELLLALLQGLLHDLVLVLQLAHVLQLGLLQHQNKLLVLGDRVLQVLHVALQLLDEGALLGQLFLLVGFQGVQLDGLKVKQIRLFLVLTFNFSIEVLNFQF